MKLQGRIKQNEDESRTKLPVIGNIKVGMKSDKGYPTSLDYFLPSGRYMKKFTDVFGDKPNTIQVVFYSDDVNEVCNERMECRDEKGRLVGISDTINTYLYDEATKDYKLTEDRDAMKAAGKWERVLTLRFIILKIPGVMGVWQLTTKGKNSSIPSIVATFDSVKQLVGTVINIPFDLQVEKVKSQKPGETKVFPVIKLIPNISKENMDELAGYLRQNNENILSLGVITDKRIESLTESNEDARLADEYIENDTIDNI
jgi:hypothetical protein